MLLRRVRGASGDLGEASVECDPRWIPFVANLKDKGYFRGEMEGSKLHQQLLASAKEYFLNSSGVEAGKEESDVMRYNILLAVKTYNQGQIAWIQLVGAVMYVVDRTTTTYYCCS